jgi:AraC family transcriptional regulator
LRSRERSAGRYRDDATADFAVVMLQNGGFLVECDLGAGRFATRSAPGQLLVSRPFTPVDNTFHGRARMLVLSLSIDSLSKLLPGIHLQPEAGFRELYTRPLLDEFIRIAINQLWAATRAHHDEDVLFADTTIVAIFAALARHRKREGLASGRRLADWQLRRVIEMLQSMQDIPLADLASKANMSAWYFARAFKRTTGVPPHRYQFRLRIDRAKDLLTRTKLPITQIAERVGYGCSQTLARAFHKEVGISPLEYRRNTAS